MGSPENGKTTTTIPATISPSDSVAIQDSTIFSYMSNLSPIKPVKATPVVPGFPGLGSPIVFTSPRLYPLPETSYLKRPRCSQLSSSVLSQQDVRDKKISICSNEIEKSKTQGSNALVPCSEKECENKGSVQDQATSPSGRIDDYLADAVEVDCVNSEHSGSLSLIQSDDVPQSLNDCSDLKEMIPKLDNKNDIGQDAEKALGAFPATSELAGQDFQEKSSFDNKPVETYTKQRSSEMPPRACLKDESDLSVDKAFQEQHYELPVAQGFKLQHAGAAHEEQWDCATQLLPESLQPIQGYGDCGKTTTEASNRLVENIVLHDPKGKQKWGMRRRCLRFEEAQQNIVAKSPGFGSPSNIVTSSRLSASLVDLEDFESSCLEVSGTSSGKQLINLTQPMISPRNSENSRSTVSKPSGIGLHLNSIINAMPLGCGATGSMKSAEKGCLNVEGRKLVCQQPANTKTASILLNVREKGSASREDGSHETQTLVAISSLASQSPQIVKPSNDPVLLKRCEYQTTQFNKRKSISKHADAVEELNQSSPKKKRKKASSTNDDDGCKRCNCKKTKCLKLYCDCFAAGIYCAETCTCQECFNRPEYEDTVLETRQQIESRNPLAFAPKIVQHVTDPPANSNGEDVINSTPYSARHKRGCNCKKSMCLKKYCECYQANVGCSNGCRCEGCKNVYGRKEGPIHESFENTFDEKLEMVSNQEGLLQAELCNPQNLTPLTPSFQFLDHGNDSSKSRFSTRRCLPSPEPNVTFLQPHGKSPGSPKNSDNHDMLLKARKDIEDVVSCYQELDYSNVETVDEFSLRYDGLVNGYDLSTLPNPPSTTMASSASSRISDWTTISRSQLYPGSGHLSSVGSLHWRSSPITSVAQFGGTKLLKAVESDEKLHDIMEDDMPELLKDTSTPINAVKVSSPNKKRVSPPHSSLKELGSSSSAGLRSGRKFILRAVPSFPPLTPSIDSKASTSQNVNDPEDCSSKK